MLWQNNRMHGCIYHSPNTKLITRNQWLLRYGFETGFFKWSLCCLMLWVCSIIFWVFLHLQFRVLISCSLVQCNMLIKGTSVWIFNNCVPYESVDNTPANILRMWINVLLKLFSLLWILGTHLICIKCYII